MLAKHVKWVLLLTIIGGLVMAGCSQQQAGPQGEESTQEPQQEEQLQPETEEPSEAVTDQDVSSDIDDKEDIIATLLQDADQQEEAEEPTVIDFGPDDMSDKEAVVDQIFADLQRYKKLEVPPIRDARTDEVISRVFFDFDKSNIKSEYRDNLRSEAIWLMNELEKRGNMYIQIEGHCDERGTNEYNIALGHRRANSVYNYIKAYSSDPERYLKTVSFGEEFPVDPSHTEEAWAQNRRAVFTLMLMDNK